MLEIGWSWRRRVRTAAGLRRVRRRWVRTMRMGKTMPMRPLVRTLRAQQAAKSQQRDWSVGGCRRTGARFGEPVGERARVSQRQTTASGMVMRVKMKMPKLERRRSRGVEAGAGLNRLLRAVEGSAGEGFEVRARARTARARGRRAAAVWTPKRRKLAAMDQ